MKITKKLSNIFKKNETKENNTFILIKENGEKIFNPKIEGLEIIFTGQQNTCILHEPLKKFINCCFNFVGDNSHIEILESLEPHFTVSNFSVMIGNGNKLHIGKNFSCNGAGFCIDVESGISVNIGDDVMFSYGIQLRTSDAHAIVDMKGNPLNFAKNITIGNHVWIAQNAFLAKGTVIPNNSVVGACSFVNKAFNKENVIIAGNPASIKKENINWLRTDAQNCLKLKKRK